MTILADTGATSGAMSVCTQVLAQRYSVGRVEEMPRASSNGRKLLVRQLVRIYTPGTAVEGLLAVSDGSHCLANYFCCSPCTVCRHCFRLHIPSDFTAHVAG